MLLVNEYVADIISDLGSKLNCGTDLQPGHGYGNSVAISDTDNSGYKHTIIQIYSLYAYTPRSQVQFFTNKTSPVISITPL